MPSLVLLLSLELPLCNELIQIDPIAKRKGSFLKAEAPGQKPTMHGKRFSSSFVSPRGLIGISSPSNKLNQDATRLFSTPSIDLFTGLEGGGFELGLLKDVLTAGATGGTGDIIAQFAAQRSDFEEGGAEGKIDFFDEPFELDTRRSLSYAVFAAVYTGGFQHFLFSILSESIPDPMVRVVINQGLIIPLCYYSLLVWAVPKLRAGSKAEERDLRGSIDLRTMIPRNWAFWVPLQFIQFNFIPMDLQVVYCSVCGLVWNIVLSFFTAGGVPREEGPVSQNARWQTSADADVKLSVGAVGRTTKKPEGLVGAFQAASSPRLADKRETSSSNQRARSWLRILNASGERVLEEERTKELRNGR